jgi:hypothetical protein
MVCVLVHILSFVRVIDRCVYGVCVLMHILSFVRVIDRYAIRKSMH